MINRLDLRFFKCFESLRLPLAPLTLLTGLNASGKSSVLQALVLLHQTMYEHEWSTRLALNGNAFRLGTMTDVLDELSARNSFEIGLEDDANYYEWIFFGDRRDMSMDIRRIAINGREFLKPQELRYLLPPDELPSDERVESIFSKLPDMNEWVRKSLLSQEDFTGILARQLRSLTYITSERIAPQEAYQLEDPHLVGVVGPRGEHAVSVLHWGRDEPVLDRLALPSVPAIRLRQVEERMRTFFPGFTLDLQQVPRTNTVTLGLRTSDDTGFHSPIHTGFGLTQSLPIVVAALSAAKGGLILVENPEIHLHPSGQALMGHFLAQVARAGIQVIVETHSDHVLNGVRRAVKEKDLCSDQVAIHFFRHRFEGQAQVISPAMDDSGSIDEWPDGFFDQLDKDASYFAGWVEDAVEEEPDSETWIDPDNLPF